LVKIVAHLYKIGFIGNTPSNLCIIDFSHGMTGSAHDANAFEHTAAAVYPNWFFEGEEFAWALGRLSLCH
jgi:hypothetical protein